jgi:hypothetical protein
MGATSRTFGDRVIVTGDGAVAWPEASAVWECPSDVFAFAVNLPGQHRVSPAAVRKTIDLAWRTCRHRLAEGFCTAEN